MDRREGDVAPSLPSFLLVGHLARDLVPGGQRPGGAALYATLLALRLGQRAAVVTSAGPDLDWRPLLAEAAVVCHPAASSTTFANRYHAHGRQQHLLARAQPLSLAAVPPAWRAAPIVLLAPLAQEVDPALAAAFPRALLGAAAQGWLRAWDESGRVRPAPWPAAAQVLPHLSALVLSAEDVEGDWALLAAYAAQVKVLAVTQGARGATIFHRGERRHLPAHRVVEVDPTGAGDVFAAAFLIELARTADPFAAARFANAAASFVVERPGVEGIPTLAQVQSRLAEGGA